MKALVYDGPKTLAFRDVPDPDVKTAHALVRVESVGICGSDMHAYLGHDERRPAPLILGHEAAGVVVGGPLDGRRVTMNPLVTCGTCSACREGRENLCPSRQIISMPPREGAFAQLVSVPEQNLVTVPDGVSLDKAALCEPLACSWHAVRLVKQALFGPIEQSKALVIGGGAIGFGAALCLHAAGARDIVLVEPNAIRRSYLARHCDITIVAPDQLASAQEFDLVIDGVGYGATRAQAVAHTKPGGVIAHIGLGDSQGEMGVRRMTLQEITFIGTYTFTRQDFRDTGDALFDGRLGALDWIESRALSDGPSAFSDILAGVTHAPKTILKPNG